MKAFIKAISLFSMLALLAALYSEAVDRAAGFDFAQRVSFGEFTAHLSQVGAANFIVEPVDFMGFFGMLAMFVAPAQLGSQLRKWIDLGYLALLLMVGGVYGIAALLLCGAYGPIDGEFFQEGMPTLIASGLWSLSLGIIVAARFVKTTSRTRSTQPPDPLRVKCPT